MLICTNCGKQLEDDAKFCSGCGKALGLDSTEKSERKIEYKGKIHKCPNCGEILDAFAAKCPACDYEIRGATVSDSLKDFSVKLEQTKDDKEKATIIRHFPIPNDKEDIWEFLILAASNINGKIDSEISDAWLAKLEQVMRKAKIIFDDKESVNLEKQYQEIIKKLNKEKSIKNAKKFGIAMAELIPVLPQFLLIFIWILAMFILMPKCRVNLDNSGTNGYQIYLMLVYIAGAVFIPLALRCDAILPKLETTAGVILSIVLKIPLLKENLDDSGVSAFRLLLIVEVICVIVIIVRVTKYNKKLSDRSATFNMTSLGIVLISMVIWLIVYGIGSIGIPKQTKVSKTSPVITSGTENDAAAGIHSYKIRNYVGKNVGSVGEVYGDDLIDKYGDGKVKLVLFTEDGILVLPTDDKAKKKYVVVGQNVKSGSKITVVNQRDDKGEPYSNTVDFQSLNEIILYIAPIGESFETEYTEIEPTLDRHKYHIKDYVGRNAASFGSDGTDEYGEAELCLSFASEDGSFIDSEDINSLKKYIIIDQDIAPNTVLEIEYNKDSSGREYDSWVNYQNYEEITFVVKELD